jgi:threonyl-tRNA synthetase
VVQQAVLLLLVLQVLSDSDRATIEKRMESIAKDSQRFQRVVVSREEALAMFQENKFKVGPGGSLICSKADFTSGAVNVDQQGTRRHT